MTDGVASTRKETEVIEKQAGAQETNASMEELNANLTMLADAAKDLLELSTELEKSMEFFTMD